MPSDVEALWREFAIESEEHLDTLERLLGEARPTGWSSAEIAQLFRSFHSLKGLFQAMGFPNLQAVAHRSEDILAVVRDGRRPLDTPLAGALLRAVDRLKDMRDWVVAQRVDAAEDAALMAELDRQHDAGAPPGGAADRPAAPIAAAPLSDDSEMLAIYGELLEQRVPTVALALSSDEEDRRRAAETATELAQGAEMMGFDRVAADLESLGEFALAAPAPPNRQRLVERLGELRQQIQLVEEIAGIAAGATPLAAALARHLAADCGAALAHLRDTIEDFAINGGEVGDLVAAAAAARFAYGCVGFDRAAGVLLLIEDQFSRAAVGELAPFSSFVDQALTLLDAMPKLDEGAAADIDTRRADELAELWRAALHGPAGDAATPHGFPLKAELRAMLSQDQIARLDEAFAAGGQHAYEVLLELEGDHEIAGDLVAWLSSSVEAITSRTVLRDGQSWVEFLVLSPTAQDVTLKQLAALDPERRCLRDFRELGDSASPAAEAAPLAATSPVIRVRSEAVDSLMTDIGETRAVLAGLGDLLHDGRAAGAIAALRHQGDRLDSAAATLLREQIEIIEDELSRLASIEQKLAAAHRRLWESGLALRVVPIETVFGRFARIVRDLAQKLGKEVDLVIEGREVRIDKSMTDLLIDPLMHMVRNAIDHGIEPPEARVSAGKRPRARLVLSAAERGDAIHIEIADDGRGLDASKILEKALERQLVTEAEAALLSPKEIHALVFRPGFSTAAAVTEISGRGVGLDVVTASLQRLGGTLDLETSPGVGTRFILKLPVSAALLNALLVRVAAEVVALPERHVEAVLEVEGHAIERIGRQLVMLHRGTVLPIFRLSRLLRFEEGECAPDGKWLLVVLSTGREAMGVAVDQILRFQELFLKELHPLLAALPAVGGASVLGNGRPILVLDAEGLMELARAERHSLEREAAALS